MTAISAVLITVGSLPAIPAISAGAGGAFLASSTAHALGSLAVLCLLIVGLGYGGWAVLREVQKVNLTPVDRAPGVIAALDPAQDVSLATPAGEGTDLALALPQPETMRTGSSAGWPVLAGSAAMSSRISAPDSTSCSCSSVGGMGELARR